LMPQGNLDVAQLRDRVLALMRQPDTLKQMSAKALAIALPESADQVATRLRGYVDRRKA
jgi:UDP-N-acetylglucosamine:LPS N-acetylglucosamine transferase